MPAHGVLDRDLGVAQPAGAFADVYPLLHLVNRLQWPEPYRTQFREAFFIKKDRPLAARIAAKRLTHFLRTGE
jgi:hypothetical protein